MEEEKPKTDYKKMFCNRCKYRFRFKQGTSMAMRCPNCGDPDISEDRFDINKVIEESTNPMFDF